MAEQDWLIPLSAFQAGVAAAPGLYFVRLDAPTGPRVVRAVVLR